MIIFGTKFWAWGSALTQQMWHCANCGYQGQFIQKKGMTFLTFYWIIPVIPVSGVRSMAQCPKCKTRYEDNPNDAPSGPPSGNSSMETHSAPIARP